MIYRALAITLLFYGFVTPLGKCFAHERPLHVEISRVATTNSAGLQAFLTDSFGVQYAPFNTSPSLTWYQTIVSPTANAPIEWLTQGSYHEDDHPRYLNHFYTVTRYEKQLDDVEWYWKVFYYRFLKSPHFFTPPVNSWYWTASENSASVQRWQDARDYQHRALTMTNASNRTEEFARMLFALGSVLHLNQDLSQPDHTRNDAHPPSFVGGKPWIEEHGLKYYKDRPVWFSPPSPQRLGWHYWHASGFAKLQDFWDRGKYTGDSSAVLDADARGDAGAKLGLAEFSNGNFVGEDALYAEYFKPGDKHYFPFPSIKSSTDFREVRSSVGVGVDTAFLKNGDMVNRKYIRKKADGIEVKYHSVLTHTGVMFPRRGGPVVVASSTINDPNVLSNYHSILIPKAVEYSAGILDYFFRGTMAVSVIGYDTNAPAYTNLIVNTSGEAFGPGSYSIYQDDEFGNRTLIAQTNLSTALSANASLIMTFPGTSPLTNKLLVVYRGSIGLDGGGAALDPVDANIAIAVKTIGNWHSSFETLGIVYTNGETLPEGWVVDFGEVDTVVIDLNGSSSYEGNGFLDLNGYMPGGISINVLTAPGQDYILSFAYARNPFTVFDEIEPQAEIWIDGNLAGTVTANSVNTWANLGWQTVSYNFTATTASTHLVFQSVNTTGAGGVLIDAVDMRPD